MTQTMQTTSFDDAGFETFLADRGEPDWLAERRRQAWEAFCALDYPGRRHEEWSRTDIRTFHLDKFNLPGGDAPTDDLPAALLTEGVDLGGRLVSHNSQSITHELDPELAARGVVYTSLDQAAREHGDLLQKFLFADDSAPVDKFAALHQACWAGGAFLYVPPNVTIDRPLHALAALTGGADLGQTLVVLDEGADATLITETAGDDSAALHCGSMEIIVRHGARLRFVSLQNWGKGTWHFARQRATVHDSATLQWTIGALGARTAKVNQDVILAGPRSQVQVNGAMFTAGRQHLAYHTMQHHRAPNCESDLLYKGALQDHSRIVWRGMIKVDPAAQKTNAYQRDDNLMLSRNARSDSIPGLEIEADDVICTHGATAGMVDEEQVFYTQCRGLSREESVRMIVAGFFQQVFDRITIESVREALGQAIGRRVRDLR
jgi:Fe-S cluster assembly protein SufD